MFGKHAITKRKPKAVPFDIVDFEASIWNVRAIVTTLLASLGAFAVKKQEFAITRRLIS